MDLSQRICAYYQCPILKQSYGEIELFLTQNLPQVRLLYPLENPAAQAAFGQFYRKFYSSGPARHLILGINPGRLGAGITGVQFTDTIRLEQCCAIRWHGNPSSEPSSAFIYHMMEAYSHTKLAKLQPDCAEEPNPNYAALFYQDFLLQSLLPLGLVYQKAKREVNFNFYDNPELLAVCRHKIASHIGELLSWGCRREVAFCLGKGKNLKVLQQLNRQFGFFGQIVPLEHPRYIMQYKHSQKSKYMAKYCRHLLAAKTEITEKLKQNRAAEK